MKHNVNIGLRDLVEGFLFSLRAEGKSNGTIEYYTYLLHPLLSYAGERGWPDSIASPDTHRLREFLRWEDNKESEAIYRLALLPGTETIIQLGS